MSANDFKDAREQQPEKHGEFMRSPPARRQITSSELLAGRNEVLIEHHGDLYTLRQTSKGKLILTK